MVVDTALKVSRNKVHGLLSWPWNPTVTKVRLASQMSHNIVFLEFVPFYSSRNRLE